MIGISIKVFLSLSLHILTVLSSHLYWDDSLFGDHLFQIKKEEESYHNDLGLLCEHDDTVRDGTTDIEFNYAPITMAEEAKPFISMNHEDLQKRHEPLFCLPSVDSGVLVVDPSIREEEEILALDTDDFGQIQEFSQLEFPLINVRINPDAPQVQVQAESDGSIIPRPLGPKLPKRIPVQSEEQDNNPRDLEFPINMTIPTSISFIRIPLLENTRADNQSNSINQEISSIKEEDESVTSRTRFSEKKSLLEKSISPEPCPVSNSMTPHSALLKLCMAIENDAIPIEAYQVNNVNKSVTRKDTRKRTSHKRGLYSKPEKLTWTLPPSNTIISQRTLDHHHQRVRIFKIPTFRVASNEPKTDNA